MSKYDIENAAPWAGGIESVLAEGETALWVGKPKKSAYIINRSVTMLPFALLWLAFDGAFIWLFITISGPGNMLWFLIPFFAFHLMPVWIWISNLVTANRRWKNTQYAVTDKRIIIQSGFIGMEYRSIFYKDLRHVSLKVGVIDKLLHVGDIHFDSAESPKTQKHAFLDIEHAYELYPKLQKIVMDIQTDIQYPNDLRPKTNSGYNTTYTPGF